MRNYQIGELVKWNNGSLDILGAVLENSKNELIVITHRVGGSIQNRKVTVNKKLIL